MVIAIQYIKSYSVHVVAVKYIKFYPLCSCDQIIKSYPLCASGEIHEVVSDGLLLVTLIKISFLGVEISEIFIKHHESRGYLHGHVIGEIFQYTLPKDINIYVTKLKNVSSLFQ